MSGFSTNGPLTMEGDPLLTASARGLRSIMENALIDTMFDLPTMDGVAKVVIDEHIVEEGAKPLLVYREHKASA